MSFQFGPAWEKVGLFPSPSGLTHELNILTFSFFHPFLPLFVTMNMDFNARVDELITRIVDSGCEVDLRFIY